MFDIPLPLILVDTGKEGLRLAAFVGWTVVPLLVVPLFLIVFTLVASCDTDSDPIPVPGVISVNELLASDPTVIWSVTVLELDVKVRVATMVGRTGVMTVLFETTALAFELDIGKIVKAVPFIVVIWVFGPGSAGGTPRVETLDAPGIPLEPVWGRIVKKVPLVVMPWKRLLLA